MRGSEFLRNRLQYAVMKRNPAALPIPVLTILILSLGALWIWVSRVPEDQARASSMSSPMRGFEAPNFSLTDQDGNIYKLEDFRGKAVLVNFWASWCPPCKAEMPAMQKVYELYKSQGFIILAVNSTIQDDEGEASAFFRELGLTFPMLMDHEGTTTQSYQVRSLPTSFFIDPKGIIQEIVIGGPMAEALLISRIERLLSAMDPIQP